MDIRPRLDTFGQEVELSFGHFADAADFDGRSELYSRPFDIHTSAHSSALPIPYVSISEELAHESEDYDANYPSYHSSSVHRGSTRSASPLRDEASNSSESSGNSMPSSSASHSRLFMSVSARDDTAAAVHRSRPVSGMELPSSSYSVSPRQSDLLSSAGGSRSPLSSASSVVHSGRSMSVVPQDLYVSSKSMRKPPPVLENWELSDRFCITHPQHPFELCSAFGFGIAPAPVDIFVGHRWKRGNTISDIPSGFGKLRVSSFVFWINNREFLSNNEISHVAVSAHGCSSGSQDVSDKVIKSCKLSTVERIPEVVLCDINWKTCEKDFALCLNLVFRDTNAPGSWNTLSFRSRPGIKFSISAVVADTVYSPRRTPVIPASPSKRIEAPVNVEEPCILNKKFRRFTIEGNGGGASSIVSHLADSSSLPVSHILSGATNFGTPNREDLLNRTDGSLTDQSFGTAISESEVPDTFSHLYEHDDMIQISTDAPEPVHQDAQLSPPYA
eukprot:ANDGO_02469.mRNA.1 hypothetical protein